METTHKEKATIALMKGAGDSNRAIARKMGRSRACIERVLSSTDLDELRQQARSVLSRAAPQLAENLVTASKVGASVGRYEGSFAALRSPGVCSIPDEPRARRTVVYIGQVNTTAADGSRPEIEWRNDDGTYGPARPDTPMEDQALLALAQHPTSFSVRCWRSGLLSI